MWATSRERCATEVRYSPKDRRRRRNCGTTPLTARTLLIGMHLALAGGRPAHLARMRKVLTALPAENKRSLASPQTGRPARSCSLTGQAGHRETAC